MCTILWVVESNGHRSTNWRFDCCFLVKNNTLIWDMVKSKGMKTSAIRPTQWKGCIFKTITDKGHWYMLQVARENNISLLTIIPCQNSKNLKVNVVRDFLTSFKHKSWKCGNVVIHAKSNPLVKSNAKNSTRSWYWYKWLFRVEERNVHLRTIV
jgi:hypothetical protein